MFKVVPEGDMWLCIDTDTHRIIGRHSTRDKANKQRRYFNVRNRNKKVRRK